MESIKVMNFTTLRSAALSATVAVLGVTSVISAAAPAKAFAPVTIGFQCVPNSATGGNACDVGVSQFRAKVSPVVGNSNQVLFTFFNKLLPTGTGSVASSITGVYFDDTPLFSLSSIAAINVNNVGTVNFRNNANPTNLINAPVGFEADFSAGARPGTPGSVVNGINPGESLGILLNVLPGFANPFDAVITDLQNNSLTLGLRGTAFAGNTEYKASFVNEAVPEPVTMLGSGAAIGMGTLLKRRAAKLKKAKAQVG